MSRRSETAVEPCPGGRPGRRARPADRSGASDRFSRPPRFVCVRSTCPAAWPGGDVRLSPGLTRRRGGRGRVSGHLRGPVPEVPLRSATRTVARGMAISGCAAIREHHASVGTSPRATRSRPSRAARPPLIRHDLSWREAVGILHEELDRLPEPVSAPAHCCYLQGLSRDEAARRLGWTVNVAPRPARSRSLEAASPTAETRHRTFGRACLPRWAPARCRPDLSRPRSSATRVSAPLHAPWAYCRGRRALFLPSPRPSVIGVAVHYAAQAQPTVDPAKSPPVGKKDPKRRSQSRRPRPRPDGKPVAGADVFVQPAAGKEPARSAESTDAQRAVRPSNSERDRNSPSPSPRPRKDSRPAGEMGRQSGA